MVPALWTDALQHREDLGLITHDQDAAHRSDVTAQDAVRFVAST